MNQMNLEFLKRVLARVVVRVGVDLYLTFDTNRYPGRIVVYESGNKGNYVGHILMSDLEAAIEEVKEAQARNQIGDTSEGVT
jgi:hypothetical protein